MISVHKKGGKHGNSLSFCILLFVIFICSMSFVVLVLLLFTEIAHNLTKILYISSLYLGPPWMSAHRHVPRMPVCKSSPARTVH